MTQRHREIAVVMPCYNPSTAEIGWSLESLRAQTVPFKLFVVDDCSRAKPDYHALLQGFDYELIELEKNVGPCIVRNPAMERALEQGFAFIAQMDCGDWAYPERLEVQLRLLKIHPEIALVGSAVEVLNDDMSYAFDFAPPCDPQTIRTGLYCKSVFKHPSMMYRAELLRRIGLYSAEFDAAEDYDLARRAARVSDLANLPTILLKKVEHFNSVSNTRRRAQLLSRLRIQWRYRDLAVPQCWLGMLRTLVVLITPTSWVTRVKPLFNRARALRPGTPQTTIDGLR